MRQSGFAVDRIELFARPTRLPAGIVEWMATFGDPLLAGIPHANRASITREIEDALSSSHRDADGTWVMDYVRLRFEART